MKRIDDATADPNANGVGVPGYTDGDPGAVPPVPPTIVRADALNHIQEELVNAVEGAGYALNENDKTQLDASMRVRRAIAGEEQSITLQTHSGSAIDTPEATEDDEVLGEIAFGGHDGTVYTSSAAIRGVADGNFSGTSYPSRIEILTVNSGSTSLTSKLTVGIVEKTIVLSGVEFQPCFGAIAGKDLGTPFNGFLNNNGSYVKYSGSLLAEIEDSDAKAFVLPLGPYLQSAYSIVDVVAHCTHSVTSGTAELNFRLMKSDGTTVAQVNQNRNSGSTTPFDIDLTFTEEVVDLSSNTYFLRFELDGQVGAPTDAGTVAVATIDLTLRNRYA